MKINNYSLFPKATVLALLMALTGISVNAQLPPLTQCSPSLIPTFPVNCNHATNRAYIISLSTTGGLNNITNNNTNCGNTATSYSDYTGNTSMFVKQNAFSSFDVKISWYGNSTANITTTLTRVYVDWNRDGDFDDLKEYVDPAPFQGTNPHSHGASGTIKVTVPGHAKEGVTRMRVITSARNFIYDPTGTACSGTYGEAEDYRVEVVNPCVPPNVISIANMNYKSADFSWTPKLNAEFYEYVITPIDTIPSDTVSGFTFTTNTSVDVDTFKCDTKYYIMVRVVCDTARKIARDWKRSSWVRDSFTTEPCCYTPVLTVDNVTSTTARVQWDPIPTSLGYEYAVSTTPDPPQKGNFTVNTTVMLQGLQSKTTHFVHVRSRCTPTPLSDWAKSGFKTEKYLTINSLRTNVFSMDAYPNPLEENLTIQLNGQMGSNARLTIIDLTGKVVYNSAVKNSTVNINAANMPSGIYIVKYTDDVHNEIMRVTKK